MTKPKYKILMVEDYADIRSALKLVLEMEGYAVVEASDGREALTVLARPPLPHLILLDLLMPKMNGYEFLAEVKKDLSNPIAKIPIIVISATTGRADEISKLVQDIIPKPIMLDRLLSSVQKFCPTSL